VVAVAIAFIVYLFNEVDGYLGFSGILLFLFVKPIAEL
jgi:hypothetical protein